MLEQVVVPRVHDMLQGMQLPVTVACGKHWISYCVMNRI